MNLLANEQYKFISHGEMRTLILEPGKSNIKAPTDSVFGEFINSYFFILSLCPDMAERARALPEMSFTR